MPYPLIPRAQHGGPQSGTESILDFSVNTNPLGPNPSLIKIWRDAELSRYPDPYYKEAREALAAYHQCDPEGVVLGVGASELLHRIVRAFVNKGDAVISLGAPFGEFARAVALQEAHLQVIERDFANIPANARLVYLSNPHNPTGHYLSPQTLPESSLTILDEAYQPFLASAPDWPLAPNLVRLQSPGKAHGVLGMRLAYALTHPSIAAHLINLQPAWAIPSATAQVLAALPTQTDFLSETMPQVRQWATELAQALGATSTDILFFTLQVPNAQQVANQLLARGLRVRDCTSFGLPDRVRIATRTPLENDHLVKAWQDLFSG